MTVKDVAGVFSRQFVVGYFIPCFVALVVLWQTLSSERLPDVVETEYTGASAVLVLGGAAVVSGLVLLGLQFPIVRTFEGYFLIRPVGLAAYPLRPVARVLLWRQEKARSRLTSRLASPDEAERRRAATALDRLFSPDDLLPTRFGNAIRAWEHYALKRWGLDTIAVWPRIDALLSEREAELHADAQTNVAFFLNGTLTAAATTVILFADRTLAAGLGGWEDNLLWIGAGILTYLLYRGAVNAAVRWGSEIRASIDLHRLDLYRKLGIRVASTLAEEREIAAAVNLQLTYGEGIGDPEPPGRASQDNARPAGAPAKPRGNARAPSGGAGSARRRP